MTDPKEPKDKDQFTRLMAQIEALRSRAVQEFTKAVPPEKRKQIARRTGPIFGSFSGQLVGCPEQADGPQGLGLSCMGAATKCLQCAARPPNAIGEHRCWMGSGQMRSHDRCSSHQRYRTPAGTTLMLLKGEPLINFVLTTV
jgi:hypothetical protein